MSVGPISAVGSETELLQCPYEISHMIMRKRFQVHLVRCRKSHPKAEVVTCPFNITHRVNKVELEVLYYDSKCEYIPIDFISPHFSGIFLHVSIASHLKIFAIVRLQYWV